MLTGPLLSPDDAAVLDELLCDLPEGVVDTLNRVMVEAHTGAEGRSPTGQVALSFWTMIVAAYRMGEAGTSEPPCRRCTECPDQAHHWMEDSDGEEWEYSPDPRPIWACKHCDFVMPMDDMEDPDGQYERRLARSIVGSKPATPTSYVCAACGHLGKNP